MKNLGEVNATNWEQEVSKSEMLTVVYFWHDQCPWCLRFTPLLDEIAIEFTGKMKFLRLNMLDNPTNKEIAANFGVMSTPTLLFICGGRPVGQVVGYVSSEDLKKALDDIHGRYQTCLTQSTRLRDAYVV
jgi:thioredoxin 1